MSFQTVKITEASMKKVGATSPADFQAKLDAFLLKAEADAGEVLANAGKLEAFETRLAALESRPAAAGGSVDVAATVTAVLAHADFTAFKTSLLTEAKTAGTNAGSAKAAEALGAAGRPPIAAAPVSEPAAPTETDQVKTLKAQGKFEEAFPLLPAAEKSDFADAKSYAAFMKASGEGKVRIKK